MIVVIMGVAGSGKTTVGELLARALSLPFYDADAFHSPENVEKMAEGIALTDNDRERWLADLNALLRRTTDAVLACSALKASYRARLEDGVRDLHFVYLKASRDLVRERLEKRHGHFFPTELLDSQFEALEEPRGAIVVDAAQPPETIVQTICAALL